MNQMGFTVADFDWPGFVGDNLSSQLSWASLDQFGFSVHSTISCHLHVTWFSLKTVPTKTRDFVL